MNRLYHPASRNSMTSHFFSIAVSRAQSESVLLEGGGGEGGEGRGEEEGRGGRWREGGRDSRSSI